MHVADFTNFFLASAGAGAALIGLLFVATSIAPEETVMASAPIERQAVATGAFTAFINAFFISLGALIPEELPYIATVMSLLALVSTITYGVRLLKGFHGLSNLLRIILLILVSLLVYSFECYFAVQLLQDPQNAHLVFSLVQTLLAIYGIALTRSWQLLGARRYGLFGWLNPLHDTQMRHAEAEDAAAPAHPTSTDPARRSR